MQLDEAYSLSALQLALDELPQAWAEQARRDPKGMFMKVGHMQPTVQAWGTVYKPSRVPHTHWCHQ